MTDSGQNDRAIILTHNRRLLPDMRDTLGSENAPVDRGYDLDVRAAIIKFRIKEDKIILVAQRPR